jgi:hypothetical protein
MTETPAPPAPQEPTPPEPTEEQLRSAEAMRYRLERNEARDQLAEVVQQTADQVASVNARAEAAERLAVNAQLRGKFADTEDFWSRTELSDLHSEDGTLDMEKVSTHAASLLSDHSHWRAVPNHGAALADGVSSSGMIGYGPRNMLDTDTVSSEGAPRDWASFLQDAARGE